MWWSGSVWRCGLHRSVSFQRLILSACCTVECFFSVARMASLHECITTGGHVPILENRPTYEGLIANDGDEVFPGEHVGLSDLRDLRCADCTEPTLGDHGWYMPVDTHEGYGYVTTSSGRHWMWLCLICAGAKNCDADSSWWLSCRRTQPETARHGWY